MQVETILEGVDVEIELSNGSRIEGTVQRVDHIGIVVASPVVVDMPNEVIERLHDIFIPWSKVEYILC